MTLGSHQLTIGKSQIHVTPRWLIDRLGPFDLDPAAAVTRPWDCAALSLTEFEDGLAQQWAGRVWLNPPFNRYNVGEWIERFIQHGDGIALLHARTETKWFSPVWQGATAILFMATRLKFCKIDGSQHPANSGAPPVLIAAGESNALRLLTSEIPGYLVYTKTVIKLV